MKPSDAHMHLCSRCQLPAPCDGTLEENFDGFPEVICSAYHLKHGETAHFLCEACADLGEDWTEDVAYGPV
jgi:hypothetical protein